MDRKRLLALAAIMACLVAVPPAEATGPVEEAVLRYHACALAAHAMMATQPVAGTIEMGWCKVNFLRDAHDFLEKCLNNLNPSWNYFWIGQSSETFADGRLYVPLVPPSGDVRGWPRDPWSGPTYDWRCW